MSKRSAHLAGLDDNDAPTSVSVVASTPPQDRIRSMIATAADAASLPSLSPLPLPPRLPPLEASIDLCDDDTDHITSNVGRSEGSLSLASPTAAAKIILIVVVEPGRIENRLIASYYECAKQLRLGPSWELASCSPSTPTRLSNSDTRIFMRTLAMLSTAHPYISKECAEEFIKRYDPFSPAAKSRAACYPYPYALPPQQDRPVQIVATLWLHLDE